MSITGNSDNVFINNANLKIAKAGKGLIFADGTVLYTANAFNTQNLLSNIYQFTNAQTAFVINEVTANTGFAGNTAPTDAISVSSNLFISYTGNLITYGQITAGSVANVESNILTLETDLSDNSSRIEALEASNVGIWSNLASNVLRIEALEASNVGIWSNLASNVLRIEALDTKLDTEVSSNIIPLQTKTTDITWSGDVTTIANDLTVGGDLTVTGNVITSNNIQTNDPFFMIASNAQYDTTNSGYMFGRDGSNVMISHYPNSGAFGNVVISYTTSGANTATAGIDFDNDLSLYVQGSITANTAFYGDGGLLSNVGGGSNVEAGTSGQLAYYSDSVTVKGDSAFTIDDSVNALNVTGNIVASSNVTAADFYTSNSIRFTGNVVIHGGDTSVAIGNFAGANSQDDHAVAIGRSAGRESQNVYAVAIGYNAGCCYQNDYSVSIGADAGFSAQNYESIAIGRRAGYSKQERFSIAIGIDTGLTSQGSYATAIGRLAGRCNQGIYSVAIGVEAGATSQQERAVAIGASAGQTGQNNYSVAIGNYAGNFVQDSQSVAIGYLAGRCNQSESAVAIGFTAGNSSQGVSAIAIGDNAGATGQNNHAVAIGNYAGNTGQKSGAYALGTNAGWTNQGSDAVALGSYAGMSNQGDYSVAIGHLSNAQDNSIVLNATGSLFSPSTTDGFFVKPIKMDQSKTSNVITYDPTTGEMFDSGGGSDVETNNTAYFSNGINAFIITETTANTGFAGNTTPTDAISVSSNLFISYTGNLITYGQLSAGSVANVESNILTLETDLSDNSSRIEALEASNVGIWSNLASNVLRIEALEASNVGIWSNLASNVLRIEALEDITTDITHAGTITTIANDLTVGGDLTVTGNVITSNNIQTNDPFFMIASNAQNDTTNSGYMFGRDGSNVMISHYPNSGDFGNVVISYTTSGANTSTTGIDFGNNLSLYVQGNITANTYFSDGTLANLSANIVTLESDLSDNSSRILTISTDLSDNSSRIGLYESNIHLKGFKVGISPSDFTPSANLHVVGNVYATQEISSSGNVATYNSDGNKSVQITIDGGIELFNTAAPYIDFKKSSGVDSGFRIQYNQTGGDSANSLSFYSGDRLTDGRIVKITENGSLSIGDDNPNSHTFPGKLFCNGAASFSNSANDTYFAINPDALPSVGAIGVTTGLVVPKTMALQPLGGGVIIGAATPASANLHVVGNVYATGNVNTAAGTSMGIGTSSQSSVLSVVGTNPYNSVPTEAGVHIGQATNGFSVIEIAGTDYKGIIDFTKPGADYLNRIVSNIDGNNRLDIVTGGSYAISCTNGGTVGVNTSNTLGYAKLLVESSGSSGAEPYIRSRHLSDGSAGYVYQSGTGEWYVYYNKSSNENLQFNYGGGSVKGYVSSTGSGQMNFTGQHRTFVDDVSFSDATDYSGLIVCSNKNNYIKMAGGIENGSNAITINESLPICSLSNTMNQKSCFGVISDSEDPDSREDNHGNFVSNFEKETGDTRIYINSVGEGAIWVSNIAGNLESGDYITTSNIPGYGQLQDDDILHNYTVAKITMDCDFNPSIQPIKKIKQIMGNKTYYIVTTKDLITKEINYINTVTDEVITKEEYDNLPDDEREIRYFELKETEYDKTPSITSEWTTIEKQELINDLNQYGQIQWEDDPTETEYAYKIRYLDANGVITTENNAIYKAAFIGCTYHCG